MNHFLALPGLFPGQKGALPCGHCERLPSPCNFPSPAVAPGAEFPGQAPWHSAVAAGRPQFPVHGDRLTRAELGVSKYLQRHILADTVMETFKENVSQLKSSRYSPFLYKAVLKSLLVFVFNQLELRSYFSEPIINQHLSNRQGEKSS